MDTVERAQRKQQQQAGQDEDDAQTRGATQLLAPRALDKARALLDGSDRYAVAKTGATTPQDHERRSDQGSGQRTTAAAPSPTSAAAVTTNVPRRTRPGLQSPP